MSKRFWLILLIIVVILGVIFKLSNASSPSTTASSQPTQHLEGQDSAGVTLVEYGDYQCPYCGEYFPIIKAVETSYAAYISFQFRNLPLTQLHPNAFAGARAAEAAGLMGKFWQMHDLLYEENYNYYASNEKIASWISSTNPETYFEQFAQQLGLNVSQFEQYYGSTQVNNLINADVAAFGKTGAQEATPTFFLNGTQIQPTESYNSFAQLLNSAIKQKTGKEPSVVAPSSGGSTTSNTAPQSTAK